MKKILLYSGGMDSWLIDKLWKPDMLVYINMHTRYSENEINHIKSQRNDVTFIDFPLGQWERDDAIIPLRNLYLPMVICNITGEDDIDICLGATSGDRVLDKSYEFVKKANDILNYLYQPQHWIPNGKKVRLNIDFKNFTKTQLLEMYLKDGGDINEAFNASFSCYNPSNGCECWQCKPCFRKYVSFALNGMTFNDEITKKVINYIKKEIKPQIDAGTYGRRDEELEIKKVLELYDNRN